MPAFYFNRITQTQNYMKKIICLTLLGTLIASPALSLDKNGMKPGASLNGYRFEFPCKGIMPDKPKKELVATPP
jgi:hypothetical protein